MIGSHRAGRGQRWDLGKALCSCERVCFVKWGYREEPEDWVRLIVLENTERHEKDLRNL